MKKYFKFIRCCFYLFGTRNWYQGVDEPTFFQRIYKWRVGITTAWKVSKIIWLEKEEQWQE